MTQNELFDLLPSLKKNVISVSHESAETAFSPEDSRIGGIPHLPADFQWPTYTGRGVLDEEDKTRPLSFLCQINLAQVHPLDRDGLLPQSGMLYFFYDLETMRWGFDPTDRGCCRVYYVEDGTELIPTPPPATLEEEFHAPARALTFHAGDDYPDYGELTERYTIDWTSDAPWEIYTEELTKLGHPEPKNLGMNTQLLGYPELIQNPLWRECELTSTGTYTGSGFPKMSEAEKNELAERSEDWMLLLQLGSICAEGEERELMFGDLGSIYFCIRRQDLAQRRFENVWLILQCG